MAHPANGDKNMAQGPAYAVQGEQKFRRIGWVRRVAPKTWTIALEGSVEVHLDGTNSGTLPSTYATRAIAEQAVRDAYADALQRTIDRNAARVAALTADDVQVIRNSVLADKGFTDVRITASAEVQGFGTPRYSNAAPSWWGIGHVSGVLSAARQAT